MSVSTALKNICLEECDRWGHTEYSLNYHSKYLAIRTGLAEDDPELHREALDRFEFDIAWNTNDGIIDWSQTGRTTDMGHASYNEDGSDQRVSAESPFKTLEEVWEFDAVNEYGLPDFNEQVETFDKLYRAKQIQLPDQLVTGGNYKTIVSGAIAAFGWDMLLTGISDPVKMEKVFNSFIERTLFHMKAWAQTSVEVIIQHDDMVWTNGPFMNPEIYCKVIIPGYARLWEPLRKAGKKILYCCDADYSMFAEDVAEAGADGFIFEPVVDFGMMADTFGKTHCLIGSYVDCRDLTFDKWDKVQSDIDRTFEKLQDCKGAILATGNHLPVNIPDDMLDRYFDYLLPKLQKQSQ